MRPDTFVFGAETVKKINSLGTPWRLACRKARIDG
jgi:hypothetical protein